MRSIRRALVGVALVLALVATGAPVAAGEELVTRDSRGDVARVPDGTARFEAAPGRDYPDITRVRFAHRSDVLVVRASFVDLRPRGELLTGDVFVRKPSGRRFFFTFVAGPGDRQGAFFPDNQNPCDAHGRFDYSADTMRMVIPRSCVGSPRWVRMRFGAGLVQRDGDQLFDSALQGRMTDGSRGPLTPRLSRD